MKYTLEMTFNGYKKKKKTNDIKEAMLGMKPDFVQTEGYITITRNEDNLIFQRRLDLVKLRKLFTDPQALDIFTSTLVF